MCGCENPAMHPNRPPPPRPAASRSRPSRWLTSPEMPGFGDAPLVGPGSELQLTIDGRAVPHDEVLAELRVFSRAGAREGKAVEAGEGLEHANLFAVAEELAARAATPSTRRQYAAIYHSFGDWLREQLGRPPV